MRPRRFLLVTKALYAAGLVAACGKEDGARPLPGNPKGSLPYEADATPPRPPPGNPTASYEQPVPPPSALVGTPPTAIPPPGNPKGSHYDAGPPKPPTKK